MKKDDVAWDCKDEECEKCYSQSSTENRRKETWAFGVEDSLIKTWLTAELLSTKGW